MVIHAVIRYKGYTIITSGIFYKIVLYPDQLFDYIRDVRAFTDSIEKQ
jgi:hypothetical protein